MSSSREEIELYDLLRYGQTILSTHFAYASAEPSVEAARQLSLGLDSEGLSVELVVEVIDRVRERGR